MSTLTAKQVQARAGLKKLDRELQARRRLRSKPVSYCATAQLHILEEHEAEADALFQRPRELTFEAQSERAAVNEDLLLHELLRLNGEE